MRPHQFELNPGLYSIDAVALRLRAYLRNRFGNRPMPKKGSQARARTARRLTCKPWKRIS